MQFMCLTPRVCAYPLRLDVLSLPLSWWDLSGDLITGNQAHATQQVFKNGRQKNGAPTAIPDLRHGSLGGYWRYPWAKSTTRLMSQEGLQQGQPWDEARSPPVPSPPGAAALAPE